MTLWLTHVPVFYTLPRAWHLLPVHRLLLMDGKRCIAVFRSMEGENDSLALSNFVHSEAEC